MGQEPHKTACRLLLQSSLCVAEGVLTHMRLIRTVKAHSESVCCLTLREQILHSGGEDGMVCLKDLRTKDLARRIEISSRDTAVPSISLSPANDNQLFCCAAESILGIDLRKDAEAVTGACAPFAKFTYNKDEVNFLAVNAKGTLLASADDSGSIVVIDIAAGTLVRSMDRAHKSIASCVSFRRHKPWELITGGLDSTMLALDFSSGKVLRRWSIGNESQECSDQGSQESRTQVCNPPMVHQIALPSTSDRSFGQYAACARGDGVLAIYDLNPDTRQSRGKIAGQRATSAWHPEFQSQSHNSAVTAVRFADDDPCNIVSGGNDGNVVVQRWKTSQASGGQGGVAAQDDLTGTVTKVVHGKKVNDVCGSASLDYVYVADVTCRISCYTSR